jgi:hypothetical protein
MGIEITPPGPVDSLAPQASQTSSGTVTGPSAFTSIAGVTSLPAGTYAVTAYYNITGTLTSAETNNLRINANGANLGFIPVPEQLPSGQVNDVYQCQVTLTGTSSILLQNIAAGGAAAVYTGSLVVTRVG